MGTTGDWDKLIAMLEGAGSKAQAEIKKATDLNGRLLEATMVGHFEAQGPGWASLNPAYLAFKLRRGLSENILEASGTLLQNIRYHPGDWQSGFVGVLRGVTEANGVDVVNIAAVHEYGTKDGKIPARPFVAPTQAECAQRVADNYQEAIKRVFE